MKLRTKSIITLIAMLLGGIGQVAAQDTKFKTTTIIKLDGTVPSDASDAGTISVAYSEPVNGKVTMTITATPATGKTYITADQITVLKTVDGSEAQTREDPGIITPDPVTALDVTADPTGPTTYTYIFEGERMANTRGTRGVTIGEYYFPYDFEITADFQSLIDITNATITLGETTFAYTGQEIKPTVSSVVLNGETIPADNYTVSYLYNIEPAEATAEGYVPTVQISGKLPYIGEITQKFTITKAEATLKYSKETAEATLQAEFEAPTLTVTPEGLQGITYSSSNTNAATIAADGKVTIVGAGETTITAAFAGDEHYKEAEASYVLTVNKIATELKYSKETAEATMGAEFEAPTLTVTPEGLEGITYTSSNTDAATISAEGKVTLVGKGETKITATFAGNEIYEAAEASYTLTVSKVTTTLKYSAETATATMGAEFEAPTLTVTPEGLEGITYTSSNTDAATISAEGKVTLVGKGETKITATFAGNEIYEAAEASYTLTVSKVTTTLKYSAETATATMGAEFEAPTLTVTPEGLEGITYTSSNTDAATISAEGKVTLVGKGETKITATFAGNEIYEAAEASYTLTVSKVTTTLKYSAETATATMGAEFEAPTLTVSPEGLQGITYTSSNTNVATIAEDGKVTIVGIGETTIKASYAGNTIYEPAEASYTLTVEKGVGEGYPLWIGEIQVTEDNCENVYGDRAQTFIFNPDSKILLITNNQNKDIVIESRLDELTIYLNGNNGNKLKKVFFNNLGNAENKGKLMFTTNFNVPGTIDLKNDQGESVITGFESVDFDTKSQLTFTLPEKTTYEYQNGVMNKTVVDENNIETTSAAEELSIGQSLTPIDETVTFTLNTLYLKDENGNIIRDESGEPKLPNLVNSVVKDVLITLPQSNDANSDEGISVDDSDGRVGITIETVSMTDEKVKTIAQKVIDNQTTNTGYFPGSDDFAKEFVGMTILLPASTGTIETDLNIDPGYEFHLLIAEANNGQLKSTIKVVRAGKVETPFDVAMPSYCYIYMVKTGAGTRLGKRDKAHGKVFSVGVSVTKAKSVNPPSEASGNALPASEDPNVNEETTPTPPTGITTVNSDQQTVKSGWYTLDGQKIAEPKQRGLYIKDGRKVVIK
jgi:hypothetical protein